MKSFDTPGDFEALCGPGDPPTFSVAEVATSIRELLEGAFPFLRVEGEITNLSRPQSGHLYFSLMDDAESGVARSRASAAQLPCVLWRNSVSRLAFRPENGQRVVVTGRVGVYEPRGTYQLIGEQLEPAGVGALQLRFEQLKERLRQEGLFAAERKRPLPYLPRCVGVVTSPSGAAVQDFLRALLLRWPGAWVRLVPVRVQGKGAAAEIVAAIERLNAEEAVEVIVVARGGGSLEDLWAFNEEAVARALAGSRVPTISAVGHEVDFTISDFVADARAQTPTQAGELAVPDQSAQQERLRTLGRQLQLALRRRAERAREGLERLLTGRFRRVPETLIRERLERCDRAARALNFQLYNRARGWDDSLANLSGRLAALSPLNVLARGYSVARDAQGRVVQDAALLNEGQELEILLAKGAALVKVLRTESRRESLPRSRGAAPREGPPNEEATRSSSR